MFFIQAFSLVLALILDIFCLFRLCILQLPLSEASLFWFDKTSDSPQGSALFALFLTYLAIPKLLVVYEPLNRWLLLLTALTESLRVIVFSVIFRYYDGATQMNTIALTIFGYNACIYWRSWHGSRKMFLRWAK